MTKGFHQITTVSDIFDHNLRQVKSSISTNYNLYMMRPWIVPTS